MASTRAHLAARAPTKGAVPGRSPGTLGINDAADFGAMLCLPGDTPGPVGFGGDAATLASMPESSGVQMILVEEKLVQGRMRRSAYLRAALDSARQDMDRHIHGSTKLVDDEAARLLRNLQDDWIAAKRSGADAVLFFCERLTEDSETNFDALMRLYGTNLRSARTRARWIRYGGKMISHVKLSATLVRKVVSLVPNPIGSGIDIVADVAEAGIKEYSRGGDDAGLKATLAEVQQLAIELAKDKIKEAPEIAELVLKAQGSEITEAEVAILERKVAGLEAKLARRLQNYKAHRLVVKNVGDLLSKTKSVLIRRRAVLLPVKGAKWLAKKGFAEVAGGVFVAADVSEAFEEWQRNIEAFSSD